MTDPEARSTAEFTAALRAHEDRYWHKHPFHLRLHEGRLAPDELRQWIANRWYYQKWLPQKDAAIIANCPLADVRRRWVRRLADQDGSDGRPGGHVQWLDLAEAAGLTRAEVLDERHVLPGVRFATDAYVAFARTRPWTEAVAASLTELFSPALMRTRLTALRTHYPWIAPSGHRYHEARPDTATHDAGHALTLVTTHCVTRAEQDAALAALAFKCEVLWSILDSLDHAHTGRGR
ncbi:pyrroloquinoline-quinone synthase PqqC [Streptomyces abikoensis]|uniref:pyrroloquinoline-quinone synthase PqqC n=1 Tax=Streptomyces abikoensis TaxID=97398 RepID=UPI00167A56CF|nr:pyrroloquinoline-quinone synthase PqqC [Streptomyces abikoensis]GGP44639.1 pyrroloquinoline-quinone synthase [Streptomyces abikoensis]